MQLDGSVVLAALRVEIGKRLIPLRLEVDIGVWQVTLEDLQQIGVLSPNPRNFRLPNFHTLG